MLILEQASFSMCTPFFFCGSVFNQHRIHRTLGHDAIHFSPCFNSTVNVQQLMLSRQSGAHQCGGIDSNRLVDSNYCSNCLEYMPSPEARVKKNKCSTCFECPSCGHTLSVRATTIQVQTPEEPGKAVAKKVYYMACGLCRWATKDVGLPDQPLATGGWQEYENPWSKRVGTLFEHYRLVAQRDKMERDRKKASQRAGYLQFSDRYGVSAVVAKKFAGLISVGRKEDEVKKVEEMQPAIATEELEPLPEEYLTEPVSVAQVCSIGQRLSQPDLQSEYTAFLQPKRKPLLIKRSQRCRECEHNLSKPEFSPASIKFKIQMAAFHHIPEVKIKSVTAFNIGEKSERHLARKTGSLRRAAWLENIAAPALLCLSETCQYVAGLLLSVAELAGDDKGMEVARAGHRS
ncbi:dynactin subunit 4 isoform X4 [Dermacentor albipictus]|uniref:dynactin subunit 4 isoform X4 n=1 Tax=Dermacentor albipictus TaxID=60249 RepID=UPI0031FD4DE2